MRRQVMAGLLLAFGLICGSVLAASATGVPDFVEKRWPVCAARRAGGACGLCGMSHAFVAMSHGNVSEAARWNPAGPWLYGAFALQTLAGAVGAVLLARRPKQ